MKIKMHEGNLVLSVCGKCLQEVMDTFWILSAEQIEVAYRCGMCGREVIKVVEEEE